MPRTHTEHEITPLGDEERQLLVDALTEAAEGLRTLPADPGGDLGLDRLLGRAQGLLARTTRSRIVLHRLSSTPPPLQSLSEIYDVSLASISTWTTQWVELQKRRRHEDIVNRRTATLRQTLAAREAPGKDQEKDATHHDVDDPDA